MKFVTFDKGRPDLNLIQDGCPITLRDLMIRCWDHDPLKRPTFNEAVSILRSILWVFVCVFVCVSELVNQYYMMWNMSLILYNCVADVTIRQSVHILSLQALHETSVPNYRRLFSLKLRMFIEWSTVFRNSLSVFNIVTASWGWIVFKGCV